MMFLGVMTFMVLPLFFVVTAQDIARKDFGATSAGKFTQFALYVASVLCVLTFVMLMINST